MRKLPTAKRKLPTIGAVLYEGPSELDGAPIIVVLTGLRGGSANSKTGKMLQTWILRADMDPRQAVLTGADASICGDCKHRREQGGACYVVVEQAPLSVYRAYQRGRYEDWTKRFPDNALKGKRVRFGSYGDPAAVPLRVWRRVREQKLAGWTGYTHQWKREGFGALRSFVMASVDSRMEAAAARAEAWRTFRVRAADEDLLKDEVTCPAAEEAGKRTTCEKCGLCQGLQSEAKDIAIMAHGYIAGRYSNGIRTVSA